MSYSGAGESLQNRDYFSLKGRFFVKNAKTPTSEEEEDELRGKNFKKIEYKKKDGTTVEKWEQRIPYLTGQIIEAKDRDGKFGWEQLIILEDPATGEQAQISADKFMNAQMENLLNRMCNPEFNLGEEVKLVPYSKPKDNGKKGNNEGVVIYTKDEEGEYNVKVEKAFKAPEKGKKADHDCPSWNSVEGKGKDKGKFVWDNNDTIEYLDKAVAEAFARGFSVEAIVENAEEDDLPI